MRKKIRPEWVAAFIVLVLGCAFIFVPFFWTEMISSTTKLELDINMMVYEDNVIILGDPNDWIFNREHIYIYEDDKILIHSSFNNSRYVYDPTYEYSSPCDIDDRLSKFVGKEGEINVWLKPDLILVYHSEIDVKGRRYPRTQDKYRSNLIFHKGMWVKYIQEKSEENREKFYAEAEPYRTKCAEAEAEWKIREKAEKPKLKADAKAYKEEQKKSRQLEKIRLRKATTPIDDSEIFKK